MRVAALYDVHANLAALEAVLAEVPEDALVLVGGDVVSGPQPLETLARLRALGHRACFIRGNADREVAAGSGYYDAPWVRERLDDDELAFLARLDDSVVLTVDGLGPTLFCHGSPRSDEEAITAATSAERLRELLGGVEQRTVVCGHTHHQFDLTADERRVVNAGSVGMSYEGRSGAYWALLGPEIDFRCTDYDADATIAAAHAVGYSQAEYLQQVLRDEIPTAADAAAFFEQQALEQATR